MAVDAMATATATGWARRRGPELALAVLAGLIFAGYLGAMDLWGKREQRASAEALDTVDHGRWLVAQIQGRPRLEKPPLPRWTVATLMTLTGRRDEWVVRLPGALSALGMVALAYGLARRLGGRSVGLAAGLALSSTLFFIGEVRQAGNDAPLAFFTTLALYAAWRRLHADPPPGEPESPPPPPADRPGARGWATLMYVAMGLGFLTKGPIALVMVAVAVVGYLACSRRLRAGVRLLVDPIGAVAFVLLALAWPVPVMLAEPRAVDVWLLEMGQKAGTAGIEHHRRRELLALEWFWMAMPWTPLALIALAMPFRRHGAALRPGIWMAWWWAFGNLFMFSLWTVAKPNYYLPCVPAVAILAGLEWVRIVRAARDRPGTSRRFLQGFWVAWFAGALAAPVMVRESAPELFVPVLGLGLVLAAAAVVSVALWRRGADAGALFPLVGGLAAAVLVAYGQIAPASDARHSHRELAATLDRLLPADEATVHFFDELDEGLWFYLRPGRTLVPVPGSQPEFNKGFGLVEEARENRLIYDLAERRRRSLTVLLDWMALPDRPGRYVLIRRSVFTQFGPDLAGLVAPVYIEPDLDRNELVLLELAPPALVAARRGPVAIR